MGLRDWLSVYTPGGQTGQPQIRIGPAEERGEPAGPPPPHRQLAFVDAASLATFPGASLVITVVAQLVETLLPDVAWLQGSMPELILALVIGAFLLAMDLTDPTHGPEQRTKRSILARTFIGTINALILAASAIGVNATIDPQDDAAANPPVSIMVVPSQLHG